MSEQAPNKLVILDRDGVINIDSDAYIKTVDEWVPIPGSIDALARLSKAGYLLAVASNQSGLARGYFTAIDLANMHNYMNALVEDAGGTIDAVCYCPHGPDDGCSCRKPLPGLLDQIEEQLGVEVRNAWYVGDTEKDIDLALSRSCRPVLVRTGKGAVCERALDPAKLKAVNVFDDLAEATDFILARDTAGHMAAAT